MDIIISTLSNLIVFNIVSNKWYVIRKNDGPYYGIAEYKNKTSGSEGGPEISFEDVDTSLISPRPRKYN